MYRVGDKVVHPMHGAGTIDSIVQRSIEGRVQDYYLLNLSVGSMTVMVPTEGAGGIGVRPVVSALEAERVLEALGRIEPEMSQNWNHRYRDNLQKMKSGDLMEVAHVVKGLTIRDRERGLSTGERKMLYTARQIMISELVLAQGLPSEDMEERVTHILA